MRGKEKKEHQRQGEGGKERWHVLIFSGAALERPFPLTNSEFHLATRDEWQESTALDNNSAMG